MLLHFLHFARSRGYCKSWHHGQNIRTDHIRIIRGDRSYTGGLLHFSS